MAEINNEKIDEVLVRGVEKIYPSVNVVKDSLLAGKKMRIYYGIDPTGPLHLGHAVQLKKLKTFQNLGHSIIILFGGFTARIGDPTDKLASRKQLTKETVSENSKRYKELIGKILDNELIEYRDNNDWTEKMSSTEVMELASNFTVSQLLERDMFQERIKSNKEIFLHEFLYPIFQANDALELDVDMQIGGNDQTFNMLAGRTLMKKINNKEKFVLTTKLLVDGSGKKMGKTEGNIITLESTPNEIFGGIMSFSDDLILIGLELLSDLSTEEIEEIKNDMPEKLNPRDAKIILAKSVVKLFYDDDSANNAEKYFIETFSKGEIPSDIEEIKLEVGQSLMSVLVAKNIISSGSEWRRLVESGAVKTSDGLKIDDINFLPNEDTVLKIGKKKFVKIVQ